MHFCFVSMNCVENADSRLSASNYTTSLDIVAQHETILKDSKIVVFGKVCFMSDA